MALSTANIIAINTLGYLKNKICLMVFTLTLLIIYFSQRNA